MMFETMGRLLSLREIFLVFLTFCFCAAWPDCVKAATGHGLPLNAKPETCPIFEVPAARMHFCERFELEVVQTGAQNGLATDDAWRLVRTPNPTGGREAVSITRTADVSKSDLEFAGLMLRCGETSVEVLIVSVRAFSPRAHPKLKITVGSANMEFVASVVPPDVLLLLPRDATALASGAWQAATELAVTIEDEQRPIHGVVPLVGLGHALALLRSNCPAH
jgi:hypothetical protein